MPASSPAFFLIGYNRKIPMKLAGFLLLGAGWLIVLAAVLMLRTAASMAAFALAGVAVEALGLALAFRSHMIWREEKP
jgi:hypothetical protein